ncbi:autotransporter outer membrane beta-barrel domain-containing protein [Lysobacter sp. GCM10012299]|uniref:autotransporter outer membrane beta-barrel domain-containing protein n=1 Tax=Lysobacter sp. GCM10012299 TaxID=3317333 RepID=UPI003605CCCE
MVPAHAQQTSEWRGLVSNDWFTSGNWFGGVPRQTSEGIIDTVTTLWPEIGGAGATAQNLAVGQSGPGTLVIRPGGTLVTSLGVVGNFPGGVGTLTVTGAGASWSNSGSVVIGGQGTGTLLIEDGGTVDSGGGSVGLSAGSTGAVTVIGPGSSWISRISGGLNIGSFGTGSLTIANGGKVINLAIPENPIASNIGNGPGSRGTATVTGPGSAWGSSEGKNIGNRGTGTLTVADGGIVAGPIVIATNVGAIGTLNIGAGAGESAAAPGTLTTPSVLFGAGSGVINFNHASASYVFASTISGNGTVNILAGTTIFTGDNTYSGRTTIGAGALQLGIDGTSGSITGNVSNNGLFAIDRSDTFSFGGVISGSGTFQQNGDGTTILTGANTYTGGTILNAGTVQIAHDGNVGAPAGLLGFNGGTLRTTESLTTARRTTLGVGGGTIETQSGMLTHNGTLSGSGSLTKTGAGTLVLGVSNAYAGGTILKEGKIDVGHGTALSSGTLAMNEGTTLGFASDGLILANAVVLTGTSDPVIDTGTFIETLSGVISGRGALTKNGSGTLVLSGSNTYAGDTAVTAGSLRGGAANAFSAASSHTVVAGAMIETGGFDQRVAALASSGTVSLVSANAGSTLTVTGPYVGNASVLKLGTGPSTSDRLVIDGATATAGGATNVEFDNLDGLGALTEGDGIEVISARNGATTTAQTTRSAFALAGGHVDAGAYEYRLQAGDVQGNGENWYLRSTTTAPPGESGGPPLVPALPPTTPRPPIQVPTFRAEVPLLAALPGQVRQADLAMLGNLHRRMGDEVSDSSPPPVSEPPSSPAETDTRRAWVRLAYSDLRVEQSGVAQPRTDLRVSGLQVGTDLLVMYGLRSGIYVGYLDGNADVNGNARGRRGNVGSNDLNVHILGAYGTWMAAGGWYLDGVLQRAGHHYEIRPTGNPHVSGEANGFLASVEGGKTIALTKRWSIEPQAQLAWQRSSFDNLDLVGARVLQDASSGWTGRLGARIKGDLATEAGRFQPYGRLNFYWATFDADAAQFVSPPARTVIASESSYKAVEAAVGATVAFTPTARLYGEIGSLWDLAGEANVKSSVQCALGVKVHW